MAVGRTRSLEGTGRARTFVPFVEGSAWVADSVRVDGARRIRCLKGLIAALVIATPLLGGVGPTALADPAGLRLSAADGAGAGPAAASSRFAIASPAMTQARAIAARYWGAAPCSGVVTVVWAPLDPDVNAVSDWTVALDANPAENSDCVITLNQVDAFDWPMLCTVVVHEMGHLSGHEHSTDPRSVMYPVYLGPIPQCRAGSGAGAGTSAPTAAARTAAARRSRASHRKHRAKGRPARS